MECDKNPVDSQQRVNSSFPLKEVTISGLFKKLQEVNVAKATGHHNIQNKILKIAAPFISKLIADLSIFRLLQILFQMIGKLQRSFPFLNQVNVMVQLTLERFLSYQLLPGFLND